MSKTKIVATLGPSSNDVETLRKMIKAGMDVVRLNFSHGTYESHERLIENIREASRLEKRPIAIAQDLQGPRIRLGKIEDSGIRIKKNEKIALYVEKEKPASIEETTVPVNYQYLLKDAQVGHRILIEDGTIALVIEKVDKKFVYCRSLQDAVLKSNKGMNFPDTCLSINAITSKDKEDIKFGVKQGVDFMALSFLKSKQDVFDLRKLIDNAEEKLFVENGHKGKSVPNNLRKKRTRIIAKIERPEAVKNIDEIIWATDAVMVARGDLGIEMPLEKLPLIQKNIITKCLAAAKPVIVATQMLNSMISSPIPTRAEVSDVANAIIDGADAIMLSGETANGDYPVEAVKTMEKISTEVEAREIQEASLLRKSFSTKNITEAVGESANTLAAQLNAKLIVCTTITGFTARNIARFKPANKIIAVTPLDYTQRQLCLSWGVEAFLSKDLENFDSASKEIKELIKAKKLINKGDLYILTTGHPFGYSDNNLIMADNL